MVFVLDNVKNFLSNLFKRYLLIPLFTTFKFTLNVAYSQASYLADGDSSYDTVAAKEVSYTPSDASWNVSSVQEAIDYLYENS